MTSNPYVFISYAHLDSETVFPCVNAMKQIGIDLWYDEGIEAGSEWPEFIAEKVVSCTKFVLFVSNAYLNSQNCKRELNFAISRKKEILSIFIEDVSLSPGMEMQLGTYQAIYMNRFNSASAFHTSLCGEAFFDSCRLTEKQSTPITEQAPVYTKTPQANTVTYVQQPNGANKLPSKNKYVAALLAIFLGGLGVHKFYLKQIIRGIVYLLLCQTGIPGILALIEGIIILCSSKEKLEKRYKYHFE